MMNHRRQRYDEEDDEHPRHKDKLPAWIAAEDLERLNAPVPPELVEGVQSVRFQAGAA